MSAMKKKLIGFSETLEERINKYAEENGTTFTEAVRSLILIGLDSVNTDNITEDNDISNTSNQVEELSKQVEKLIEENAWFKADDTQSRLGNTELNVKTLSEMVEKMDKKINVVISSSKLFKKHIDNRSIHLQD